jgi:F-type H+-transporting ATPase subunit delta
LIGTRVTLRYSKALFELAKEKKILDRVGSDLEFLLVTVEKKKKLQAYLESPLINLNNKLKLIATLFKSNIEPLTFHFLSLLLQKKREYLLRQIIFQFKKLLDADRGILRAELQTYSKLTTEQLDALEIRLSEFSGKKVLFDQIINEDLVGGFIIRMDDTVIDNSMKNQLIKLHEKMLSNS